MLYFAPAARINVVVTESIPLFAEPDLKGGRNPQCDRETLRRQPGNRNSI
jgi:hypothetical protein